MFGSWPGNACSEPEARKRSVFLKPTRGKGMSRELQHVMERASILAQDAEVIDAEHLYFSGL